MTRTNDIQNYYKNILNCSKEAAKKEHFIKLLERIYGSYKNIREILDEMGLGAERSIVNIVKEDRVKYGSADTQYGQIIIEFENDLRKTEAHAKEQLKEYLIGNWKSGEEYNFTLISSDCITWKVYSPSYEQLSDLKNLTAEKVELFETDSFVLDEGNSEDFYFFIDRYLLRTERINATLESIQKGFGERSEIFINSLEKFKLVFSEYKDTSEIKTAFNEWEKFLSVAYGTFKGTNHIFLVHTYMSVLSKGLAYLVLTHDKYVDDDELEGIITGTIFARYNVNNFVDDDFYHWVSNPNIFKALKSTLRKILQELSAYDYSKVQEDILKGLYQELIDIETRHSLGEYYTPDWLCEEIVNSLQIKKYHRFLDPACGSGSFLRAIIDKLIKLYPDLNVKDIMNQVVGIDIHPLSVQISKCSVLIALHKKIAQEKKPVQLNIFLANSLFIPTGSVNLLGEDVKIFINSKEYVINSSVFMHSDIFDQAINICEKLSISSLNTDPVLINDFKNILKNNIKQITNEDAVVDGFYNIYKGFKLAKESGEDSIWKFILQNLYKPFFLRESFDYVIGNPPWLTYSDITNRSYQDDLKKLATEYKILSSIANMPHLEIADIFIAHSTSFFLKKKGKIVFVLPRSFLTADHHDLTRAGKALGYKIESIWDLKDVMPLFRVPSCVITANQSDNKDNRIPVEGIDGYTYSGKLKKHNHHLSEIKSTLKKDKVKWFYIKLQKRSAFSNNQVEATTRTNYYKKYFKQGATIVPRNCYFIDIDQEGVKEFKNRVLNVKTSEEIKKVSKAPWDKINIKGKIESKYLFRTALSKNIVPFALINPPFTLVPIKVLENEIELLDYNELQNRGDLNTAEWFAEVSKKWEKYRTQNNRDINYVNYLNWQNKLTGQDFHKRYLVLYTASSKDASATIVDRTKLDLPFVVESKAYWFSTDDSSEAYYLVGFLNSSYPNKIIKDFQSRGLFGPRDVHKKILEIPLNKFSNKNVTHNKIVELSKICSEKVKNIAKETDNMKSLGRIRLKAKDMIKSELKELDSYIVEICK